MKTGPERTCLGCRQKKKQGTLWRFSVNDQGIVAPDLAGKNQGRHAYSCKKESCLYNFLKNKKGLSRTFRQQVLGFDEEVKKLFGSD